MVKRKRNLGPLSCKFFRIDFTKNDFFQRKGVIKNKFEEK